MSYVVRLATVDDADTTGALHVRSWQTAYRGMVSDAFLDAMSVEERQAVHRDHIANPVPDVRNWVVEDEGGHVVGWAATGPPRDEDLDEQSHELYAIYLAPNAVGRGFGRALMERCLKDARERGYSEMVMWVLRANERAQGFYAAAGFGPDPRVEPKVQPAIDALKLRMARAL